MDKFITATVLVASLSTPTIANSALIGRLAATEGGTDYQAYYDEEANLTWLADANAVVGTIYDTYNPGSGDINWFDATSWAASLNIAGVTGWRLPNTVDVDNDGPTYTNKYQGVDWGYNITAHSELSNMFYNVLGNTAAFDTNGDYTGCRGLAGYCLTNTGPFINLQPERFWSATEVAVYTKNAWAFNMWDGNQITNWDKTTTPGDRAWAVQSGDVGSVPIPAAVWLFGSGLIGLVGFARRK